MFDIPLDRISNRGRPFVVRTKRAYSVLGNGRTRACANLSSAMLVLDDELEEYRAGQRISDIDGMEIYDSLGEFSERTSCAGFRCLKCIATVGTLPHCVTMRGAL